MSAGIKSKKHPIYHGVLLLDKSKGLSSNGILGKVKWLFGTKKAGHTGTLDPMATGLLPICLGEATKFSTDLLEADKAYDAELKLGVTTTTGDAEGELIERRAVNVTQIALDAALSQLRGKIIQVPPMYSALKRDGRPLYEYARAGIELAREGREVVIHALQCTEWQDDVVKLSVTCSKGTYVRVLAEDLGKLLGCGAHLTALRRTQVGRLSLAESVTAESLEQMDMAQRLQYLQPVDALLTTLPSVNLDAMLAKRFLNGQRLPLGEELVQQLTRGQAARVRVYDEAQCLLGTAQLAAYGVLSPERLIAVNT